MDFALLLVMALLSNIIANEKPLLVRYQGHLYLPFMFNYAETTFGGELQTATDYQDPFVVNQLQSHGWVLWAPLKQSYNSINFATQQPFPSPPSRHNLLGTDSSGHDVLAEILYGLRISLFFGVMLTLLSSLIGIVVGATQGYYGGRVDLWGQRFIEVWAGMPTLFLIILLSSVVQPNFWWLLLISVLSGWMVLVGVVRAEFLRTRNFDYVRAAQAMGVSDTTIMLRHMLPNATVATLTFMPFILCGSITTLASLDFLGFGLPIGSLRSARCCWKARTTFRLRGWGSAPLWCWPSCCRCLFLSVKRCATLLIPASHVRIAITCPHRPCSALKIWT